MDWLPDQPPDAEQAVALVDTQVSVLPPPATMDAGDADRRRVGGVPDAAGGKTVATVT